MAPEEPAKPIRWLDPIPITGDAATAYLAYASLAQDLELAQDLLERLEAHPAPEEGENDNSRMALWIAITTTYGRCFGQGRRQYFAETFVPQYFDEARLHRWILGHRNRTIAHLDDESDEERATAYVGVDGDEVLAIKYDGERWLMPDPPTIKRLHRLFRYLVLKARTTRGRRSWMPFGKCRPT